MVDSNKRIPTTVEYTEINAELLPQQTRDLSPEEFGALMMLAFRARELPFMDDEAMARVVKIDVHRWREMKDKVLTRLAQVTCPGPNQALRLPPETAN
jgi:hypothetical protein